MNYSFIGSIFTALAVGSSSVVPAPRDIPLPLPFPEWFLVIVLIVSFLLHILFVNLMLGGSILTLWAEIKGIKNKEYNVLAHEIGDTVTVNKSLAVVIGVAPLLSINVLYTVFFYSANALTGMMWISIVPLVSLAFLLLYVHKYTWERYKDKKRFHIAIIAAAVIIFLFVPFIFLTNINLMLFPDKWGTVKGFFSAMMMRNVVFRYFHFICASLAITGLFLFWRMKRKRYPFETIFSEFSRPVLLKKWYKLALFATITQLGLGPLNLFTLPWDAVHSGMIYVVVTGASFAIFAMVLMWKEIKGPEEQLGKRFYLIAIILSVTVLLMGTGRHIYRASALSPHIDNMREKTAPAMKIF